MVMQHSDVRLFVHTFCHRCCRSMPSGTIAENAFSDKIDKKRNYDRGECAPKTVQFFLFYSLFLSVIVILLAISMPKIFRNRQ